MEQEIYDEIENVLRLAEWKPTLIEALLQERREIDAKLAALGYQPPKRTRKPRAPATKGSAPAAEFGAKRHRSKKAT